MLVGTTQEQQAEMVRVGEFAADVAARTASRIEKAYEFATELSFPMGMGVATLMFVRIAIHHPEWAVGIARIITVDGDDEKWDRFEAHIMETFPVSAITQVPKEESND